MDIVSPIVAWFDVHERDLPWRRTTPWGVLVSEFMLQQTPVVRVLPVWHEWMNTWPTASALAAAPVSDALRAWGRLGYPRRAKRLHQAATAIVDHHGGEVPEEEADLLALPGVGAYTAAAVLAFAFGQRSVVLDVNIRRVLARALDGEGHPAAHITNGERRQADLLWPIDDAESSRWSAAVMELGALVCTARTPQCDACPVAGTCAWLATGGRLDPPSRRRPTYEGSDRQARGMVLAHLRASTSSVSADVLRSNWEDEAQVDRAISGLIDDGLIERTRNGRLRLATC